MADAGNEFAGHDAPSHGLSGQEFSGKTVEEATEEGLAQLGLRADQAEIEVISRGSRGIFGIGSEPARVRIARRAATSAAAPGSSAPPSPAQTPATTTTPATDNLADESVADESVADDTPSQDVGDSADDTADDSADASAPRAARATTINDSAADIGEATGTDIAAGTSGAGTSGAGTSGADATQSSVEPVAELIEDEAELAGLARELLQELVQHMGFECTITDEWREPEDDESERFLHLDIQGKDLGALIGRRGETLASIQYLVRLMVNQRIRQWKPIIVDVENYKERRNNQLTQLATRMAEQVVQSGRAMSLEPMPANERRIIHLTLRDHPDVYTQSSGEGDRRKVHIVVREE